MEEEVSKFGVCALLKVSRLHVHMKTAEPGAFMSPLKQRFQRGLLFSGLLQAVRPDSQGQAHVLSPLEGALQRETGEA